ncbi:MAG: peptide deformylase [Rhodobacter sp.]|nr:peptide deformylase [Rhodobacter sp.]MCY4168979.1 peptide deformylase [Rhodobacter sp.]
MTVRNILIHPDPRLRKCCERVDEITPELRNLADDMLQTMYDAPGIGLAAPQIGELRRLIVMDCAEEPNAQPSPVVLFNPETVWNSEEVETRDEGCLSIPEQFAEVQRPAEVRVRWEDLDGRPREEKFDGLWARCVQHEIDHLNGRLFVDYLTPLKRQMITRKMVKLKRERARA